MWANAYTAESRGRNRHTTQHVNQLDVDGAEHPAVGVCMAFYMFLSWLHLCDVHIAFYDHYASLQKCMAATVSRLLIQHLSFFSHQQVTSHIFHVHNAHSRLKSELVCTAMSIFTHFKSSILILFLFISFLRMVLLKNGHNSWHCYYTHTGYDDNDVIVTSLIKLSY